MLHFTFSYLLDNKYKMIRLKLIHNILPFKQLLQQWNILDTCMCVLCYFTEDYGHIFLKRQYFYEFLKKVYVLVSKAI